MLDRRARDTELVKVLALLHNAVSTIRREGSATGSSKCALVVSDTSPADGPHAVYLFRRWLPLTFAIKAKQAGGFEFGLLPAASEAHRLEPGCSAQMHFSLASHSALALTAVSAAPLPSPAQNALAFL